MKTTLIIMAAGIGSRFGGGIKQLAKMGPNGEIIMDYSIYDAKEDGFDKVVFIIRKDIEEEFKEVIGNRIQNYMDVEYVFQDINDLPEGFTCPEGRTKPWGTGQAVLCAKSVVDTPYVIINADDYYGKEAFVKLHDFLINHEKMGKEFDMGMAGFILKNTLSENGTVTRGVCKVDDNNLLKEVYETTGIKAEGDKIVCDNPEPICDFIIKELNRSATVYQAQGAFTHHRKTVIMTTMRRSQAVKLRNFIRQAEPTAFMLISNSSEIIGKGFLSN